MTSWRLVLGWMCLWLPACGSPVLPLQTQTAAPQQPVEVLVVPLTGVLGTQEIALCHRALREAGSRGMRVVLQMRDAGGINESAADVQGLLDHLQALRGQVETTAVVQGKVIGGAAYAALLCDRLYFLRRGSLGAIATVPSTLEMLLQFGDEEAERQRLRAYASELRARLDKRQHKLSQDAVQLCAGMADSNLRLVRVVVRDHGLESTRVVEAAALPGLETAGATIVSQSPVTQPVVLDEREAEDAGLSQGTLQSLEQLCTDVLTVDQARVGELQMSWAEHMVGWLEYLQPVLLVLGFVLLLLEVKTPGFGLPGALGVILLGLALFYSYLVGLADVTEILLFFLGLAGIVVEIFLLPGTIVFGAVGFLCLLFSLLLSRQTFVLPSTTSQEEILLQNLFDLTLMFVLVLVFAMLFWRLLPRVPLLRSALLTGPEPSQMTAAATEFGHRPAAALLGRRGRARTVLRPSGVLEIDGEPYDVVTRGEYVEAGVPMQVVAVEGNRIVVERAEDAGAGPAGGPSGRPSQQGSVGLVLLIAIVGLCLLVAEVLLVSFGLLSVLSGVALISAVFLAFQDSSAFGVTVLVLEAVMAPIVLVGTLKILPKTRLGKAMLLEPPPPEAVRAAAEERELARLLHCTGVAVSPLRPAGFARIDGRKVDVVTRGEMLDAGCPVRVVEVLGNRVVVAAHDGRST